jgi:AcrR family transcriptional regulator
MTADHKQIWITTGYATFALTGNDGLKIEPLAKKVGISKSSFYHHFADTELFMEGLLDYHLQQCHIMARKEGNCQCIDPELIHVMLEHKMDLLFNRQLRVHRANKLFNNILTQSNQITADAFVAVWVKDLGLRLNKNQLAGIFELALENFFLQITAANLTQHWLTNYFANLKEIALRFN